MNRPPDKDRITPSYRPGQAPKQAPCQEACLNCGDIRGWIALVAQRNRLGLSQDDAFAKAWEKIAEVNPFPATLGRICPHPCESACNRGGKDEPLAINAMERFLGDFAVRSQLPLPKVDAQKRKASVGVVGAGPSGLSFAYQMARRGYSVTVYDAQDEAGGMLRFGVPPYRLPKAVLEAEISKILDLGVKLELGVSVGKDLEFETLRNRHDCLYLGVGAQQGRALKLPGAEGPGVITATSYLERVNRGELPDLGGRVVVIGGGNSAMDAARSARRGGAEVTILYRRSLDQMPASQTEIEEAAEEGVELKLLVAPMRFERNENGHLDAVCVAHMVLGNPDASGRPRPVMQEGTEERIPADTVILAISQQPVLEGLDGIAREGEWLLTDSEGAVDTWVFAGGDAVNLGMAGSAIVQGRHAAERLHEKLSGGDRGPMQPEPRLTAAEEVLQDSKQTSEAARTSRTSVEQRLRHPGSEVSETIDEASFLKEVERCFSCGSCFGCERCYMYCTAGCFTRVEEARPGAYFSLNLDACQECGKCVEVCPCGFLEVT
jgi:NADPH-dependent glutamate synthase beta subunit-like oxidoreductase/Pyruvate/2-oxoacid:ferredoxin oxidoreductase delta subunit